MLNLREPSFKALVGTPASVKVAPPDLRDCGLAVLCAAVSVAGSLAILLPSLYILLRLTLMVHTAKCNMISSSFYYVWQGQRHFMLFKEELFI